MAAIPDRMPRPHRHRQRVATPPATALQAGTPGGARSREDLPVYRDYRPDLMAQVLDRLTALSEVVAQLPTRDDLAKLEAKVLTTDVYQADQRALVGRLDDHATRMTKAEDKLDALQAQLHEAEKAEIRAQAGTQRQFGQGLRQVSGQASDLTNKVLFALVGFLGAAVVQLLYFALSHR